MGRRKKIMESIEPELKTIAETEPPKVPGISDSPVSEEVYKLPESPGLIDFQEKDLFNIDEAADYMSVSAETIRLWIDHGHLAVQLTGGIRKIPLESMIRCRIKGRFFHTLPNKEYLRPDEVANYFSLSVKTIYGWIDSGEIEAVSVGPGNTVRIRREEVEKMVQMKED